MQPITLRYTSGLNIKSLSLSLISILLSTSILSPGLLNRKYKDDISFDNSTYMMPQNNAVWVVSRNEPYMEPQPHKNICMPVLTWTPCAIESRNNENKLIISFWYGSILPTTLLPLISIILLFLRYTTLLLKFSKYLVLRGQYPLVENGISTALCGRKTGSPVE